MFGSTQVYSLGRNSEVKLHIWHLVAYVRNKDWNLEKENSRVKG